LALVWGDRGNEPLFQLETGGCCALLLRLREEEVRSQKLEREAVRGALLKNHSAATIRVRRIRGYFFNSEYLPFLIPALFAERSCIYKYLPVSFDFAG
jgi:hypothetical protein